MIGSIPVAEQLTEKLRPAHNMITVDRSKSINSLPPFDAPEKGYTSSGPIHPLHAMHDHGGRPGAALGLHGAPLLRAPQLRAVRGRHAARAAADAVAVPWRQGVGGGGRSMIHLSAGSMT